MIIVVGRPTDEVKEDIISEISQLESKCHIAIDPLMPTKDDFLDMSIHRKAASYIGSSMATKS